MFELRQHPTSQSTTLTFDNESLNVLIINRVGEVDVNSLVNVDGILVQTNSASEAEEIQRKIRSGRNRKQALIPVFISSSVPQLARIEYLFDGVFSDDTKGLVLQTLKSINQRLKELNYEIHQLDFNQSLIQSSLQYLYSRQISLIPNRSRAAKIGFAYPFLSSVLTHEDGKRMVEILSKSSLEGHLNKQKQDTVHSCKKCSGGYLNYRECCPKCGSADLKTEDLIHHFLCAHIAPEQDYKQQDHLECPKCDKELRHIGIDYDKPSSIHTCNDCNHQFQQAEVKALCIDCGHDNELSQLGTIEINSFELTPMGEQAAKYGMHVKAEEKKPTALNTVSESIFELFKTQETERSLQSGHLSWEGSIRVNLDLMGHFHSDQQELIQKEVCTIISNYLSKADILSSPSSTWYRFLVYDTEPEKMEKIGTIIQTNVTKLLADGMNTTEDVAEVLISSISGENNHV